MAVIPLRARVTFWWGQRVVNAGDIVMSDDAVVRRRAELFEPVPSVEQATAAPGERRTLAHPIHRPKS